jgi:hypothetical protein
MPASSRASALRDKGFCQISVCHSVDVESTRFGAINLAFDIGDKGMARVIQTSLTQSSRGAGARRSDRLWRLFAVCQLLTVLSRPYEDQAAFAEYANPPQTGERVFRTFCGT